MDVNAWNLAVDSLLTFITMIILYYTRLGTIYNKKLYEIERKREREKENTQMDFKANYK